MCGREIEIRSVSRPGNGEWWLTLGPGWLGRRWQSPRSWELRTPDTPRVRNSRTLKNMKVQQGN